MAWGANDPSFIAAGATVFRADLPEAEIHLLDAGHFALDEKTDAIAVLILAFMWPSTCRRADPLSDRPPADRVHPEAFGSSGSFQAIRALARIGGDIPHSVRPMNRLDAMQVMLTAVECGSLSKASRKLGQPLATVSRKVSELECHLKADLLIRSSRGLELTPAGRTYIAAIRTVLEQLNEAERAAAGEYTEPKGDLVVTAPIMFGRLHVLPVVTSFLKAFPEVSVDLILTDRVTHIFDDQIDVALRIGDLLDSSLIATGLGTVRRVTCASPAYLSLRAAPAVPQDLADHDVISFESVSSSTTWSYWSDGDEVVVTLRSRLSVNTIDAAIDAGVAGAGVIRTMSYQVAAYVHDDLLRLLLERFEPKPRPVHLIYGKRNRLPLKLRAFIDFVVPHLRDHLKAAAL